MFGLGMAEVVVVLVIGLLLFGNRLPSMARSLGKTIVDFKKETTALTDEIRGPSKLF